MPETRTTRDSTSGYAPPTEPQRELPPLDHGIAIGIGAAGIATGFVISAIGIASAYDAADRGYDSPAVQRGIVVSGSGVLLSAFSALVIERVRAQDRPE